MHFGARVVPQGAVKVEIFVIKCILTLFMRGGIGCCRDLREILIYLIVLQRFIQNSVESSPVDVRVWGPDRSIQVTLLSIFIVAFENRDSIVFINLLPSFGLGILFGGLSISLSFATLIPMMWKDRLVMLGAPTISGIGIEAVTTVPIFQGSGVPLLRR
jgi:hypothetical protein